MEPFRQLAANIAKIRFRGANGQNEPQETNLELFRQLELQETTLKFSTPPIGFSNSPRIDFFEAFQFFKVLAYESPNRNLKFHYRFARLCPILEHCEISDTPFMILFHSY